MWETPCGGLEKENASSVKCTESSYLQAWGLGDGMISISSEATLSLGSGALGEACGGAGALLLCVEVLSGSL